MKCNSASRLTEVKASRDLLHQKLQLVSSEREKQVVVIRGLQESASEARIKHEELKSEFMKCIEELSEAGEARAELEIHKEAANEYRSSNGGGREENEAESGYAILIQKLLFGILNCGLLYLGCGLESIASLMFWFLLLLLAWLVIVLSCF